LTVTTTKLMQNMMWAITMVQKPSGTPALRKSASSDAPSTTSGVAIGRKISRLVDARPRNRWRASANAIIVPRTVDARVASAPILRLLTRALQTSGAPHGLDHFSVVKPRQFRLDLPESLNENTNV
jgi:hypothetical protein